MRGLFTKLGLAILLINVTSQAGYAQASIECDTLGYTSGGVELSDQDTMSELFETNGNLAIRAAQWLEWAWTASGEVECMFDPISTIQTLTDIDGNQIHMHWRKQSLASARSSLPEEHSACFDPANGESKPKADGLCF